MSSSVVLLVCDATFETGSGHVMRQITLGIELKKCGLEPILFCQFVPESLISRAEEFGLTVRIRSSSCDSPTLAEEILSISASAVVFDGYHFSKEAVIQIHNAQRVVMLVDDNGEMADFPCHIILNQNLHADARMYACR